MGVQLLQVKRMTNTLTVNGYVLRREDDPPFDHPVIVISKGSHHTALCHGEDPVLWEFLDFLIGPPPPP